MRPVAVTGATGFVGRHVVSALRAAGRPVRVLARRDDPDLVASGAEIVRGALEEPGAVRRLVDGATAVVHCAGLIAAPSAAAFASANVDGTRRLLDALAPGTRLVHVSSLAAREPGLSAYAASKRRAEDLVAGRNDAGVVRPPAVYGPGDRTTLPIFRQLVRGRVVVPAGRGARFSLIFVEDLARLLATLATVPAQPPAMVEPDDGRLGGYGWADLARLAGDAMGRRCRALHLPPALAWPVAVVTEGAARVTGSPPRLGRDKLRELAHPDWVCRGGSVAGAVDWRPKVGFAQGFRATVAWYRRHGWL
jgi:nucleoside-diphosphate-sugar epimerase